MSPRKDWPTTRGAREVIINRHVLPYSILTESNPIDTILLISLRNKQPLDEVRHFSQAGECRHEPAVSELSLLDVAWLNILLKDFGRRVAFAAQEFTGPLPDDRVFERVRLVRVTDALHRWWELDVNEMAQLAVHQEVLDLFGLCSIICE